MSAPGLGWGNDRRRLRPGEGIAQPIDECGRFEIARTVEGHQQRHAWERETNQSGRELAGGVVGVDDVDVSLQARVVASAQGCAIEQRAPAEHQ